MRRKVIIFIVLFILFFVFLVNIILKRNYIQSIDTQVEKLFRPTIENTVFLINEEKYVLGYNDSRFSKIDKRYYTRLEDEVLVEFSIYKDEINKNNLVSNSYYTPRVKRDTVEGDLYIYNTKRSNNIIDLVDVIFDEYFNLCAKEYDVMNELNGLGQFEFDNIMYDEIGKLVEPAKVSCSEYIEGEHLKIRFSTEFMMVPDGENIEIIINADSIN